MFDLTPEEWHSTLEAIRKIPAPDRITAAYCLFPDLLMMIYDIEKLSVHLGVRLSVEDFENFKFYYEQGKAISIEQAYCEWIINSEKLHHSSDTGNHGPGESLISGL